MRLHQVIERFGIPAVGFYRFKGLIEEVGSLDQVATKLQVDPAVLRETIREYQEAAESGEDKFGKVSHVLIGFLLILRVGSFFVENFAEFCLPVCKILQFMQSFVCE